ncbi:biopolymer transporter ExbD [Aureisphaera galaxeae]|uniref:ExbD/TolR family protein n=1 Tax=Aureisphaera galaxeae TaxID=1538023 RepID=UPI0023507301|nr:biopolymer transporter ExbD [Aureisphaera galaxeae]MDC8004353.1 biopolymer transporter ExbD [Aureisphaera galaxeae]
MRNSRQTPSIHTGSMADIAFLLLIFFLVTTIIPNDKGIPRVLPKKCVDPPCDLTFNERNVLRLELNQKGELRADEALIDFSELKETLKKFIDNNGDKSCTYCEGIGFVGSSDNPTQAIISLQSSRKSRYKDFIAIQVELNKAYFELREHYIAKTFKGRAFSQLSPDEIKQVRDAYPLLISEAELK